MAEYEENEVKEKLICAVKKRNFAALGRIMMESSNQLHAMCLGTYPPLLYLNDDSLNIISLVHVMNEDYIKAAYTFDAGPNPIIFTLQECQKEVLAILNDNIGDRKVHTSNIGSGACYSDKHLF
jgi:diphosphomevalonate decarboxylase